MGSKSTELVVHTDIRVRGFHTRVCLRVIYDTKVRVGFLTSVCIYVYELYATNVIRGDVYERHTRVCIRGFVYELYDTKVIVGFLTSVCIYVYELYVTNVIRGAVYDRFFFVSINY